MAHPLDGPKAKIQRAYKNVSDLAVRLDTELSNIEIPISLKGYTNDTVHIRVEGIQVPDDVSAQIGEVFHDLRSCLDHLYYQLVILQRPALTIEQERSIQFPIIRESKDYIGVRKGKVEGWVRPNAYTFIDGAQPCNNPPVDDHFLSIVAEFNNRDKHRLLIVGIARVTLTRIELIAIGFRLKGKAANSSEMQVYKHKAGEAVFPKFGTGEERPVIPSLVQLIQAVENLVISSEPLFS